MFKKCGNISYRIDFECAKKIIIKKWQGQEQIFRIIKYERTAAPVVLWCIRITRENLRESRWQWHPCIYFLEHEKIFYDNWGGLASRDESPHHEKL